MNKAYLLIGGNLGDRNQHLATAIDLISEHIGKITKTSSIYETEAWGKPGQPSFLNQALELETKYNAKQLIRRILRTEKNMGRIRHEKYGPRIIDIDILLFNEEKHHYPFLNIPHPELHNRRFALEPLAEIAINARHIVLNKTVGQLLEECEDKLPVKKVSGQ